MDKKLFTLIIWLLFIIGFIVILFSGLLENKNPSPLQETVASVEEVLFGDSESRLTESEAISQNDQPNINTQQNDYHIKVFLNDFQGTVPVNLQVLNADDRDPKTYHTIASASTVDFEISDVSAIATIVASASGYISSEFVINEEISENELSILLNQDIQLSLHVTSGWSESVEGAEVKIISNEEGIFAKSYYTDASGNLITSLPHPGEYLITAYHANYNSTTQKRVVLNHNPNHIELNLQSQSGTIMGFVYDENNKPIANVKVNLFPQESYSIVMSTQTDSNGQYYLFDIPLDQYNIGIKPGNKFVNRNIQYEDNQKINTLHKLVKLDQENSYQQIDFYTKKAVIVEGIVVDENYQPISNTLIKLALKSSARSNALSPTKIEAFSDENGIFVLPVTTQIENRSELLIGGIHPDYNYTTKTITGFDWETAPEPVKLIMSNPNSQLEGKILESSTGDPVPNINLNIAQYAFRYRDPFIKTIQSDQDGNYKILLPEGNYIAFAREFEVKSPVEITLSKNSNISQDILVIQKSEQITIKGVIKDQKGSPVHHANIRINPAKKYNKMMGESTVSIPDGSFQMEIPVTFLDYEPIITVSDSSYQTKIIPLSQFNDYQNIEINLDEYIGSIHVSIANPNDAAGVNLYLYRTNYMSYIEDVKNIDATYTFRRLDPSLGPFRVIAGNNQYLGVSEIIDLDNFPMKRADITINLNPINDKTTLTYKIINSETKEPIPIVTCTLNGLTFDSHSIVTHVNKTALTNFDGEIQFNQLPTLTGSIEFKNGNYINITIPVFINGDETSISQTIELSPLNY